MEKISVREFNENTKEIFNHVQYLNKRFAIHRHGKFCAVIIPIELVPELSGLTDEEISKKLEDRKKK